MLKSVMSDDELREAVAYIGSNYKTTPYLYVNLLKYGAGTDNVHTWIDWNHNHSINGLYLLYYDCIHFYTKNIESYPIDTIISFIKNTKHNVIMLQGGIGDRVNSELGAYLSERNHVIDMDKCGLEDRAYKSTIAQRDDINEIVDLLITDPEYTSVYNRQVLSNQLFDRYDSSFSRYFVIKMDGKVVAACSTYGEVPGFALVGGTIVHPDYRRMGLASDVENYSCYILQNEGKSRVGFVNYNNINSLALHEKIGAVSVATLAKFIKKED